MFEDDKQPKPIMRRGVLMSLLQQKANTLPLWVSKPGEMCVERLLYFASMALVDLLLRDFLTVLLDVDDFIWLF